MRSEIRREAISLLLGNLGKFQMSGAPTQESIADLLTAINNILSIQDEQEIDINTKNFVELLLKFIPRDCVNYYSDLRVQPQKWEEWLQICWGHDDDTLTMLSILPKIENTQLNDFINCVQKLPIIQSPALNNLLSDNYDQKVQIDNHIHLGALCPPSLQWAHWINTGFNYLDLLTQKKKYYSNQLSINGYELSKDDIEIKIKEHSEGIHLSHRYLTVARILIGAMLDFSELSASSNTLINLDNDKANCSDLIKQVTDALDTNQYTRARLISPLEKWLLEFKSKLKEPSLELKNNSNSFHYLLKSNNTDYFFKDINNNNKNNVKLFLKAERQCIAKLLWLAYKNKLGIFFQEILFIYLRCKGAWFQINSGKNLKNLKPYEHLLLKNYDLLITIDREDKSQYFQKFHSSIQDVVRKFYPQKKPEKVQLRLPYMNNLDISRSINWLTSIYENTKCDLVLSFPRYNLNKEDINVNRIQHEYRIFIETVQRVIDQETSNGEVDICGVDLVGNNENIDWVYYAKLLSYLRNEMNRITQKNSCFITYHLDQENNLSPLEEICEILTIVNEGGFKANDRISHAWSLLSKVDQSNQKHLKIDPRNLDLIKFRLGELKLTSEQKQILNQLEPAPDNKSVKLDPKIMSKLVDSLQPLVQKELIAKEICLEVCPTSSWCIAGISLPTQHPVKSWIEAEGKVLVGTDNPAVFPCTIESEYYSLQRLMEQSNMPEVTSQTSSEQNNYKWDVFLSHSSADKKKVREVANKFRNHGLKVWLDEEQIHPGDSVTGKIEEGVTYSKKIIVCLSPSLGKSNWCRAEYGTIINDEISLQGTIRVIPLVIESVERANIPLFLRDKLSVVYNDPNDWQKLLKHLGQPDEIPERIPTKELLPTMFPSTNEVSRTGSCSCVDKLGKLNTAELRRRIEKRLQPNDIKAIWFDTFDEEIEIPKLEEINDRVIKLINKANQERKISTLIESLCNKRPDLEKP